jgi:nitrite reductase/ring-hydroxylating ferredoxin subunit
MDQDRRRGDGLPVIDAPPTRRQLLCGLGCAVVASQLPGCTIAEVFGDTAGQAVSFNVADAEFTALDDLNGMAALDVGIRKILLIRRNEAEVIALDRICSHLQCEMIPGVIGIWENDGLRCVCHNSRFSAEGALVAPPTGDTGGPIEAFAVEFDASTGEGTVYVGVDAT